jgi:hypothetical protein
MQVSEEALFINNGFYILLSLLYYCSKYLFICIISCNELTLYIYIYDKGFPTRIASICIALFLLSSLIPLTESLRYNVIEAACSIGSIITTDGTNDADIMFGCDLEDVIYGEAENDVLPGRDDDDDDDDDNNNLTVIGR